MPVIQKPDVRQTKNKIRFYIIFIAITLFAINFTSILFKKKKIIFFYYKNKLTI